MTIHDPLNSMGTAAPTLLYFRHKPTTHNHHQAKKKKKKKSKEKKYPARKESERERSGV